MIDTNEVSGFLNNCPDPSWLLDIWHSVGNRIGDLTGRHPMAAQVVATAAPVLPPIVKASTVAAMLVPKEAVEPDHMQPLAFAGVPSVPLMETDEHPKTMPLVEKPETALASPPVDPKPPGKPESPPASPAAPADANPFG